MTDDFAIPQPPRCYLKRHSENINYRNDWCDPARENADMRDMEGFPFCEECSIARAYKSGHLKVKPGALKTLLEKEAKS